ncbi:protein LYK5 isoform X2 [Punica granatum]|uniref:Protein LYK5 isoform X2 n=1 Tax=Punica granatum TaxID=22663 RepID=A0A6P8CU73_PUNGR|nr:protein LYK5 isoform X2 [Punica granatum]
MCKSKMSVGATQPVRSPRPPRTPNQYPSDRSSFDPASSSGEAGGAYYTSTSTSTSTSGGGYKLSLSGSSSSAAASSSRASLSSLRQTLPENVAIYDLSELRSATNNFLSARRSSSSSSSWRCSLRGKDVIVFQRKFRRRRLAPDQLRDLLGALSKSHLANIAKLLGACASGEDIYLVYEFVAGASLSECLRNPKNPSFTVLKTWISRMQVATDVAHALDYIHNNTGLSINLVHNHVKSSSIVVTEPNFQAKLCQFGAAQLCGEIDENGVVRPGEISEEGEPSPSTSSELARSNSRVMQFQGVRGYMSPEFRANGIATQKADVYALGVVMLELLSGEEPFKYRYDKAKGDFIRTSIIETAMTAVENGKAEGRLRQWIDRRLGDSFPVEAAEKLIRLALDCVQVDPNRRPDMSRVAGKVSKLYVQSKTWSDNLKVPTGISVSLGPR